MPAGNVTTAFFIGGVPSPFGSSFCGNFRSTSSPVGESGFVVSGLMSTDGVNVSLSHPVTGGERATVSSQ